MAAKPFNPEQTREIISSLQQPAVFLGMTWDWPSLRWSVEHLSHVLGEKPIQFRMGKRESTRGNAPLFETQCDYVKATMLEFLDWTQSQSSMSSGPFAAYPVGEYWAYADYKYIAVLFKDTPYMFESLVWSDFGYPGRNGQNSTIWIGTKGANTPCHQDSYGYNLVLQIQGRKKWYLFSPEDTRCLYPTRIPYEESSVFSQVNVVQPDYVRFPAFAQARAHVVTLQPGQVLFVPRHWWHYVESIDPVTVSINSWIEMEVDDDARVGEALTKTIICAMKTTPSSDNADRWLNPTEDGVTSHDENLLYLSLALRTYMDNHKEHPSKSTSSSCSASSLGKRNSSRDMKRPVGCTCCEAPLIPFGEQLKPVPPHPNQPLGVCTITKMSVDPHIEKGHNTNKISTNDLLEVLVHPDVIALVTRLLVDRQNMHGCE